jgi:hypothetical protein
MQPVLAHSKAPLLLKRLNSLLYLDARVYPPIEGLQVEAMDYGERRGLLIIVVPPQPERLKPFLVHGALVGSRVEGAFISIVRRRGEASIPISAPAIHTMLAAGRSLLQGRGKVSKDRPDHAPSAGS